MGPLGPRTKFNNFILTYICRLSTLVLEVQLDLLNFDLAPFGPFLAFFAFQSYFWALDQIQKVFETYQSILVILLSELEPYLFSLIPPNVGHF